MVELREDAKHDNIKGETASTVEDNDQTGSQEALRKWILAQLDELDITQLELANAIGFSSGYLSKYLAGQRDEPGARFLVEVARFFRTPITEVLRIAGYNVPARADAQSMDEHELIDAYRKLSRDDQTIVLRIVNSFVAYPGDEDSGT